MSISLRKGTPAAADLPNALIAAACSELMAEDSKDTASDTQALQYGDDYDVFTSVLASFLSNHYATAVLTEHLYPTSGVSGALDLICAALSAPGDVVLCEASAFFLVCTQQL